MLIESAIESFCVSLYDEVKPATIRHYQRMLSTLPQHLGNVPVASLRPHDLRLWRKCVAETTTRFGTLPSTSTKNTHLKTVKLFFTWLEREGVIESSPVRRFRYTPIDQSPEKSVTFADFRAILAEAQQRQKYRDVAVILFLMGTGCRVSSLIQIEPHDLHLSERRCRCYVKSRHIGKWQWMFLDQIVINAIEAYLQHQRPLYKSGTKLFLGQQGNLTRQGVWYMLKSYQNVATGRLNPHAFRHGFAQNYLQNGGNLAALSQLLGHSNVKITADSYGRFAPSPLQAEHGKYSPLKKLDIP